jgi:hypothetical protein
MKAPEKFPKSSPNFEVKIAGRGNEYFLPHAKQNSSIKSS